MSFGMAVYNDGIETLYSRDPINLFYAVNIINPKEGTLSFTVPDPGTSGTLMYTLGPMRQPYDITKNMGGTRAGAGFVWSWAFKSVKLNGRHVTVEIIKSAGGQGDLSMSFFTKGG